MKAPFPYPGGKSRAAVLIWQAFGTNVKRYIEPFCGSMAALLARPRWPDNCVEIVNDLDGCLVNAWRAIRRSPEAVAACLDDLGGGHEVTLAATSRTLRERRDGLVEMLKADIEAHDVAMAAAWLHGQSSAINSGRENPGIDSTRGKGVLSCTRRDCLLEVLSGISSRLRHVRILCGDWTRPLTDSWLHPALTRGNIGILLDPPYRHASSSTDMYAVESDCAADVATWAIEHGTRDDLRIVLCGLAGEHQMPTGWRYVDTMTLQAASRGKTKRQDRLYISPRCLPVDGEQPCIPGEAVKRRQQSIFDLVTP